MTPEAEARERAGRMKCFLELILLPEEALREEFPELFGTTAASSTRPPLHSPADPPGSSTEPHWANVRQIEGIKPTILK